MPFQDLTPQLRTRLSRLEFVVGLFVTVAALLMVFGLGYYVYLRAERKGWFLQKLPYFTFVRNAAGLNVGDKVKLMGFDAGEIREITPEAPGAYYDVFVQFEVWEPYYGYLWADSKARVAAADLLGKRYLEVTKGNVGVPTYLFYDSDVVSLQQAAALADQDQVMFGQDFVKGSEYIARACRPLTREQLREVAALGSNSVEVIYRKSEQAQPTGIWDRKKGRFEPYQKGMKGMKGFFLEPEESPALTELVEGMVQLVQTNLPHWMSLTNQVVALLSNASQTFVRADRLLAAAEPIATNLAVITAHIRDPQGSLGQWLIPTQMNTHLNQTLATLQTTLLSADQAVIHTDARLGLLVTNLNASLLNLAQLTSNLNAQVQSNTNLVTELNRTIIRLDEFIQGLTRHWLLRSAFKKPAAENADPPKPPPKVLRSPRDSSPP